MAKSKTVFFCQNCGSQAPKWLGRCPECGEYNTFVEERVEPHGHSDLPALGAPKSSPKRVEEIEEAWEGARLSTSIKEFDRVLGGGVVSGSAVLIGGDPGIGKSTLLLQAAAGLAQTGARVVYLSGEEATAQVRMRAM